MNLYQVDVHREDNWYVGRVLERSGVTTQGRTLDELVSMLRDAIKALWGEEDVQLKLVLTPDATTPARSRARRSAMGDEIEPEPGQIKVFIGHTREPRICDRIEVPRGLLNVIVDTTAISQITQLDLYYRGRSIDLLVQKHTFQEVAHLLLFGNLPDSRELGKFCSNLLPEMNLGKKVTKVLKDLHPNTPPIDVLRTAVSVYAYDDKDASRDDVEASRRKSVRLLGQVTAAVGWWAHWKHYRTPPPAILPDVTHGANLLRMITGQTPPEAKGRVLDKLLILYAEHGFNSSAFAARTIVSSESDMHSAVCGAIGSLKGKLHGGAIAEAVLQWQEIQSQTDTDTWYNDNLGRTIMGFGHRVYKAHDCRETIARRLFLNELDGAGDEWFRIADVLTNRMCLRVPPINPNLDLAAAYTLPKLGVADISLYAPIFACARVVGWCAHIMEQQENNKLIRPVERFVAEKKPVTKLDAGGRDAGNVVMKTHQMDWLGAAIEAVKGLPGGQIILGPLAYLRNEKSKAKANAEISEQFEHVQEISDQVLAAVLSKSGVLEQDTTDSAETKTALGLLVVAVNEKNSRGVGEEPTSDDLRRALASELKVSQFPVPIQIETLLAELDQLFGRKATKKQLEGCLAINNYTCPQQDDPSLYVSTFVDTLAGQRKDLLLRVFNSLLEKRGGSQVLAFVCEWLASKKT